MRDAPEVDVIIEIQRGSFLKRGSTGHVDFISPLPTLIGGEGDQLDAVVLGPRLPAGTRVRVAAWGAIEQVDRGMMDYKLICSTEVPDEDDRRRVLRFFHFYARCKGLPNVVRGRRGRNACDGWVSAEEALAAAKPRDATWRGPVAEF